MINVKCQTGIILFPQMTSVLQAAVVLCLVSFSICSNSNIEFLEDVGTVQHEKVGFVLGVWDMFHQGHENVIRSVATKCDKIIIGIHKSEFVEKYKNVKPFMSTENREILVRTALTTIISIPNIVIIIDSHEEAYQLYPITTVFHGDDWEESAYRKWIGEDILEKYKVSLVVTLSIIYFIMLIYLSSVEFFPYTKYISSTSLRNKINENPVGFFVNPGLGKISSPEINTLSILYDEIGGIWMNFSFQTYLYLAGKYPLEPNIGFVPQWINNCSIGRASEEFCKLSVWIFSQSPDQIRQIASNCICNDDKERLIINLPHGRSGKGDKLLINKIEEEYQIGNIKVKEYYTHQRGYINYDKWLSNPENSFTNPIPDGEKPKLLVIASWNSIFKDFYRIWKQNIENLIALDEFDVVSSLFFKV